MTRLSKVEIILAEQDKGEAITLIAYLLQRLSKLYQLTNWTNENAVFLAEWIYDNYKFDSLDDVIKCLKNPPHTENKQWRLTPDTIKEWMKIILEERADQREVENKAMKEAFKEPLKDVDYDAFKTKVEVEGLPGERKRERDPAFEKFRMEYLVKKQQENTTSEEVKKPE